MKATRATQLAELAKRVDPAIQQKTAALFPDVSKAAAHAHLPMVNLALGTLRHLTADQFKQFSQTLQWLIESDGKIELFEFVLQKIVLHHLAPQFGQGAARRRCNITPSSRWCRIAPSCFRRWPTSAAATPPKFKRRLTPARRICARRMKPIWYCCRANNAAWTRLTPRSTAWRRPSPTHQKEPARSLHPHRRRGRRDSGSGSRTAPRHRRHAGLPDAAVCGGGIKSKCGSTADSSSKPQARRV